MSPRLVSESPPGTPSWWGIGTEEAGLRGSTDSSVLPDPICVRCARYVAESLRSASGTSSETSSTCSPGAESRPPEAELNVSPNMMRPCNNAARNSIVSNRSRTGALPSRSVRARGGMPSVLNRCLRWAGFEPALDGLHQQVANIQAELLIQLTDPRGARYIDLGDKVADHIQADEHHPLGRQRGSDLSREPTVPVVQRPSHPACTR